MVQVLFVRRNINTFDNILQLQKSVEVRISGLGGRGIAAKSVIDFLFRRPVINAEKVSKVAALSMPSSYKLISNLERTGILKEITGARRKRMYAFDEYLNLFR